MWYDFYQTGGLEALEDKPSRPSRVWNRISDEVRGEIVQLALDEPDLSPRELAAHFTDTKGYFVSEASVYRLLKAHDPVPTPAFIVVKAADEFNDKILHQTSKIGFVAHFSTRTRQLPVNSPMPPIDQHCFDREHHYVNAKQAHYQKDALNDAAGPVPLSVSRPLRNRRMGGAEAG
jgi:Homeodomain-like domain